jgi:SpoIIAA-like
MIETIPDMPAGTFGFRAHGNIAPQDYRDVVLPPLRGAVQTDEQLRVLIAVGPEFREEPATIWEALKADVELGIRHRQAWQRVAVVSDMGWVRRASELFAWMMPGELRAFSEHELEAAKGWLAAEQANVTASAQAGQSAQDSRVAIQRAGEHHDAVARDTE